MGRLVTLDDIQPMAIWYFDDAYFSRDGESNFRFKFPSDNFPYLVHINYDTFYDNSGIRPIIRAWVESNLSGTVIIDKIDLNYKKYYGKKYEWDKSYEVTNKWTRFSFSDEESKVMFTLRFSEYIKPLTKWHPDRPEDEEYLSRPEEDRYIK